MPTKSKKFYKSLLYSFPIILLFVLVFTGFDLSVYYDLNISFNFVYILIFFLGFKEARNVRLWFNFFIRVY